MSNDNCGPDPVDRPTREAAYWIANLDDPNLPPEELLRWNEWQASPTNGAAFDSLASLCRVIDSAARDINSARRISEEAAYWYVMCEDGSNMQPSDRREFETWLNQAPEHVDELLKIGWLGRTLRRRKIPRPSHRPVSLKLVASAASVVVGAGVAVVLLEHRQSPQTITTEAGQPQRIDLPDGTAVHVDARSKVVVTYTDKQRVVYVSRGSAVFEVAIDHERPFIARTDLIDATATGTRFGVAIDPGVITTVSDGIVKVTGRGKRAGKEVMLQAGDELRVSDKSLTSPQLARVDAKRKLQWTSGQLVLGGLTVAEGVAQLNRRNRTQIVVESAALGARVVEFASVSIDAPERYAKIIAAEPGVKMTLDEKNHVIRLSE